MKHTKKLASLLLALVMVLSLGITVFAADGVHEMEGPAKHGEATNDNGKITINDAIERETYDIYQLLYLESYSKKKVDGKTVAHYAYKANSSWSDFVNSAAVKDKFLKIDDSSYVTWVEGADAAAFAKLALEYAQTDAAGKKPGEDGYTTPKIAPVKTATAASATVEFTGLKLGYYLIDTSLGSLCSLDTTDPEVVMQEKNEVPKNYKQVKEDSGAGAGAWRGNATLSGENDADIGQQVEFRSVITVYPGTDNLIFHDQMTEGLTFTQADADSISVQLKNEGGSLDKTLVKGTDYTVEYNPNGTVSHVSEDITGNCTFHVKFSDSVFESLQVAGTNTMTISYTATLNENAKVGVEGNPNTSRVSYGDDFHATPESKTKTRTYGFPVFKLDKETKEGLSDTKFELHANNAEGKPGDVISLIDTGKTEANGAAIYRVATPKEIADSTDTTIAEANRPVILTEITTNDTGRFVINGLDAGTYHLVETEPKNGYNKLKNPVAVNITYTPGANGADGTVTIKQDNTDVTANGVQIENGSGSELPSTGGIGTTIFYVAGSILLIGAAVLLITKKRMNAAK